MLKFRPLPFYGTLMSSTVYMLSGKEPQLGHNSVQRTPTGVLDFGFAAGETDLEGLQNAREGCRLSGHRAYLRQVPSLDAFLQGFPIHLQYYRESFFNQSQVS
jgi:hypothetical protein